MVSKFLLASDQCPQGCLDPESPIIRQLVLFCRQASERGKQVSVTRKPCRLGQLMTANRNFDSAFDSRHVMRVRVEQVGPMALLELRWSQGDGCQWEA